MRGRVTSERERDERGARWSLLSPWGDAAGPGASEERTPVPWRLRLERDGAR